MQQNSNVVHAGGVPMFTSETIATATPSYSRLNVSAVKGLSISQTILGGISLLIGVITVIIYNNHWYGVITGGIVGGAGGFWILVTGALGIAAAQSPNSGCLIGTTLAFNIIAILVTVADGIVSSIILIYVNKCTSDYYYNYYYHLGGSSQNCKYSDSSITALYSTLMAVMVIEFFLAFITSIYCCCSCCGSAAQGVVINQYPNQGFNPNQVMVASGINAGVQQPMVYHPAPANYFQQPHGGVFPGDCAYAMQETDKTCLITSPALISSDPPPYTPQGNVH